MHVGISSFTEEISTLLHTCISSYAKSIHIVETNLCDMDKINLNSIKTFTLRLVPLSIQLCALGKAAQMAHMLRFLSSIWETQIGLHKHAKRQCELTAFAHPLHDGSPVPK